MKKGKPGKHGDRRLREIERMNSMIDEYNMFQESLKRGKIDTVCISDDDRLWSHRLYDFLIRENISEKQLISELNSKGAMGDENFELGYNYDCDRKITSISLIHRNPDDWIEKTYHIFSLELFALLIKIIYTEY